MTEPTPRRAERVPLRADISFRRQGDHRYPVTITDFSAEGCRLEAPIKVNPGDPVWIKLPGLKSIEGVARWVDNWTVGVEFDRPLHPAVFDHVRAAMKS